MTDWHCHILPGIDDGAKDIEESLAMAKILLESGFSNLYCTPHCMRGVFDNTPEIVQEAVDNLQSALTEAQIPLKLHTGMEYFLDEFFPSQLTNPVCLGDTHYLLVEAPVHADPEQVKDSLFAIRRRGLTPILAHPERYEFLHGKSQKAQGFLLRIKKRFMHTSAPKVAHLEDELLGMGCLFQGNLGAFSGIYGSEVKRRAEIFLNSKFYFCFGSDAHNAKALPQILESGRLATANS